MSNVQENIAAANNKLANIKAEAKSLIKWGLYFTPAIALCTFDAYGVFDFDKAKEASITPMHKFVIDITPVVIFTTGLAGAFLSRQGDLLEKMVGFGKGALGGGLLVAAVRAGMSI